MEVSQTALWQMLGLGVVWGAVLGVLYDVLRLFRVLSRGHVAPPNFFAVHPLPRIFLPREEKNGGKTRAWGALAVTVAVDFLFGVCFGTAMILLVYDRNDGIFRFSAPSGLAVGFFLYRFTLGRLTERITDVILYLGGCCIRAAVRIAVFPFCLAGRKIRHLFGVLIYEPHLRRVSKRQTERLYAAAEHGFLPSERTKQRQGK